jgi:hypothetical protein
VHHMTDDLAGFLGPLGARHAGDAAK